MIKRLLISYLFILGITHVTQGQSQFKRLLRYNLPPFGVTFYPEIIYKSNADYTFVEDIGYNTVFFKLDSGGNFIYSKNPKFNMSFWNGNPIIKGDRIFFLADNYFNITDTTGSLLERYELKPDSNSTFITSFIYSTTYNGVDDKIYCSGLLDFSVSGGQPLVFKLDTDLNLEWAKYVPVGNHPNKLIELYKHIVNQDGLYTLMSVDSISATYHSYSVLKFDHLNGNLLWAKKYLESPYYIKDIIPFDSTSVLLYGMNDEHPNGINPYWDDSLIVMRIDTGGNVIWCRKYKTLAGVMEVDNVETKIINTKDRGFLLAGQEYGFSGTSLISASTVMIKFDSLFNIQWTKKHEGGFANSVIQTSDNGFLVCGGITLGAGPNDVYAYIIKTDSLGSAGCFEDTLSGIIYTTMNVTPVDLNYTTDTISLYSTPVATGDTMMGSFTEYDACVFLGVEEVSLKNNHELIVYPNPATTVLNIMLPINQTVKQIEVYDMQGRLVMKSDDVNAYPLQLDVSQLTKGIYVVKIVCGAGVFNGRVAIE